MQQSKNLDQPDVEDILASIRSSIAEEQAQQSRGKIAVNGEFVETIRDEQSDFELPAIFKSPAPELEEARKPRAFKRLRDELAQLNPRLAEANLDNVTDLNAVRRAEAPSREGSGPLRMSSHFAPRVINSEPLPAAPAARPSAAPAPEAAGSAFPAEINSTFPANTGSAFPTAQAKADDGGVKRQMASFMDTRMTRMSSMPSKPLSPAPAPLLGSVSMPSVSMPAAKPTLPQQQPAPAHYALPSQPAPAPAPVQQPVLRAMIELPRRPAPQPLAAPAAPVFSPPPMIAAPVPAQRPYDHGPETPVAGSSGVDDVAAQLLRPMLRQWLAENMPKIVEKALRSEGEQG